MDGVARTGKRSAMFSAHCTPDLGMDGWMRFDIMLRTFRECRRESIILYVCRRDLCVRIMCMWCVCFCVSESVPSSPHGALCGRQQNTATQKTRRTFIQSLKTVVPSRSRAAAIRPSTKNTHTQNRKNIGNT